MKTEGVVTVAGGGLAGCEAALVLARLGRVVVLREMKPSRRSPAHATDRLCELVCSNSLRSDNPLNAIGLLHEELRRAGSPLLAAADASRVPAGDALAVDRSRFSTLVEEAIGRDGVRVEHGELERLPDEGPCVVATGPLTSDALAASIAEATGGSHLYFYDAIAPIVAGDSVDRSVAFAQSRYDKGGADYLNLPFTREEYGRFVAALLAAEKVVPHAFEEPRYFEGCLPVETMAERGPDVLAHGPMKPVGLTDPRTGRRPWAAVQLRREDEAASAWNLVGFQTRLTWPEQERVFRTFVPGLANAEFLRLGQVHRNTFLCGPKLLAEDLSLRTRPHLFFAGQITGVEGYVESMACGHLAALAVEARLRGEPFRAPPAGTALGALHGHVTGRAQPDGAEYQPSNVTWALFPALDADGPKNLRRQRRVERARALLSQWLDGEKA